MQYNFRKHKIAFYRYLIVGGGSTVIDYFIYIFLWPHLGIAYGKAISMVAASIFSFLLSSSWVFRFERIVSPMLIARFYIAFTLNFMVNISSNYIVYQLTNNIIFSFFVAAAFAIVVNFSAQSLFVFRKT